MRTNASLESIRFYDSDSALAWAQVQHRGANVVLVTDLSSGSWSAELAEVKTLYRCKPPFVLLHVSSSKERTDGIVIWAIQNGASTALVHAVASLPPADTIAAVSLALEANAIHLQSVRSTVVTMYNYLCLLFGKRTNVEFDLPRLLRKRNRDAEPGIPAVVVRNTSGRRTLSRFLETPNCRNTDDPR